MAEVDFSNARIEPVAFPGIGQSTFSNYTAVNPTEKQNVSIAMTAQLYNANSAVISRNGQISRLTNERKQLTYLYQGTFNASGTEFYIIDYGNYKMGAWRISNISFSAGDTYVFTINATLTCN